MTEVQSSSGNREQAMAITKKHSIYSGALGLLPIPLIEFGVIPGAQIKLVHDLAKLYKVPFSESLVKALLASITGVGVAVGGKKILTSLLKGVPIIGQATALMSAGVVGGTTWAIGKVFTEHFEAGGTLLTINADKIKAYYEDLLLKKPVISADPPNFAGIRP